MQKTLAFFDMLIPWTMCIAAKKHKLYYLYYLNVAVEKFLS